MSPTGLKAKGPISDTYSTGGPFGTAMTGEFAAAWLPAVFVPIVGIVFPAVFIVLVGSQITASE
jgi:photosystem I subunit 8